MNHPISVFTLWLLYFALHSFLASDAAKNKAQAHFGARIRYYRLAYNLFALLGLAGLLWHYVRQEPQFWWFVPGPFLRFGGAALAGSGLGVVLLAFRNYDFSDFAGLDQLHQPDRPQTGMLQTSGLNNWVRHPLYLGTLLGMSGIWLLYPTAATTAVFASVLIYLPAGIWLEERKLLRQFGDSYREYQKRVKRLIPFLW